MNQPLADHFAMVRERPGMFLPLHTVTAASAYVSGVLHDDVALIRSFNRWFGETYHGRPELAFWSAITGELINDTRNVALDLLTPEQDSQGVDRLFALLEEFLEQPELST